MKKLCILLAVVCCLSSAVLLNAGPIEISADSPAHFTALEGRTSTWNKAATDGVTATSAIPRIAVMEGRTSTWNQAAADGITATSAIPRIAVMEGRTSTWDQAAADGVTATSAIPRIAVVEGRTSTWNQAATDASSWTNAQAAALKSVTNSWTDTNGVAWYVVMSAAGMITHWSTNVP